MTENRQLPEDTASASRSRRPSKDTLNLVIAVCAVLISAASFVAGYLQSDAAYRQVKAETWPFLQLETGNFDIDQQKSIIAFNLKNAGVGPAHVKSFVLLHEGKPISNFWEFAESCCVEPGTFKTQEDYLAISPDAPVITDNASGGILPSGEKRTLFLLERTEANAEFWQAIDQFRRKLTGRACYCSLLQECYKTDFESDPVEVKTCPKAGPEDYRG